MLRTQLNHYYRYHILSKIKNKHSQTNNKTISVYAEALAGKDFGSKKISFDQLFLNDFSLFPLCIFINWVRSVPDTLCEI